MSNSFISFGSEDRLTELISNLAALDQVAENKSEIEVRDSTWITPFSVLPICAMAERHGKDLIVHSSCSSDVLTYLKTIGFPKGFQECGPSEYKSYIPITRLELPTNIQNVNAATTEYAKLISSTAPSENVRILRFIIDYIVGEMTNNILEHSEAGNLWMFAQKWTKGEELEFCIVDDGITFLGRYKKDGFAVADDTDALAQAIENRRSVKQIRNPSEDRGYGLSTTKKLITGDELRGRFAVLSGSGGYFKKHGQKERLFSFPGRFDGTIISGRVNFPEGNSDNIYKKYLDN